MNKNIANVSLWQCFIGYFQEVVYKKDVDLAKKSVEDSSVFHRKLKIVAKLNATCCMVSVFSVVLSEKKIPTC